MSSAGQTYAAGPTTVPGPKAKFETWLWIAQRASAAVLALCVLVHLATIIYAVHHGLTGAAILARTRGNAGALAFYCLYVLAIAVHAPIGLRSPVPGVAGLAQQHAELGHRRARARFVCLRAARWCGRIRRVASVPNR